MTVLDWLRAYGLALLCVGVLLVGFDRMFIGFISFICSIIANYTALKYIESGGK